MRSMIDGCGSGGLRRRPVPIPAGPPARTRSERAREQPRDRRGRFAATAPAPGVQQNGVLLYKGREPTRSELTSRSLMGSRDLIVVDESNSFSSRSDGRRRNLTVVCTRVRDPKRYVAIARDVPAQKGKRTKYSTTYEPSLSRVLERISSQNGLSIVEAHRRIDYDRLRTGRDKEMFYMDVLEQAVDKAVAIDPGSETDIILDSPPVDVDRELREYGRSLSERGSRIRWMETAKSAATPALIVHDFETGAVSDKIEGIAEKEHLFDRYLAGKLVDDERCERDAASGAGTFCTRSSGRPSCVRRFPCYYGSTYAALATSHQHGPIT